MWSAHPRRVRAASRPQWWCSRCAQRAVALLLLSVIIYAFYFSLHMAPPPASLQPSSQPSRPAEASHAQQFNALPKAHSLQGIRAVCAAQAPELQSAPWMPRVAPLRSVGHATNSTLQAAVVEALSVRGGAPASHITYRVVPHPICVDRGTGLFYVANADRGLYAHLPQESQPMYPSHAHPAVWETLDDVLPPTDAAAAETPGSHIATVVPALGVFAFAPFITTHMWHLLRDVVQTLTGVFMTYGDGALWRLPRQAVLLDAEGSRWLDRDGDTPQKMAISAAMFNIFSSFPGDAPLSSDDSAGRGHHTPLRPVPHIHYVSASAMMHAREVQRQVLIHRSVEVYRRYAKKAVMPKALVCYCQGLMVRRAHPPPSAQLQRIDELIQDRVARQFSAPPYRNLTEESVWDIERQRIERYPPWARQFWPATTTVAAAHTAQTAQTAVYQPRVLFIHRAKRTIANVAAYVRAMRDLGFRVEEVYLERLPTDQQYYLGRYADVVVGMHGLGIGHALWMNRYPTGCRTVIEFRLWASPGAADGLEGLLSDGSNFSYHALLPYDVRFGSTVPNKRQARLEIIQMWTSAYQHPGWDDQEAIFLDGGVRKLFKRVKTHLDTCLKSV